MFQSANCECLAIPSIKERKHRKTGHARTQNISQIGSFKSGWMPTLRVLQQFNDQLLSCPDQFGGRLRAPVLDANAVTVVADSSVKRRMNA
jgi:hypothetical protein